MSESGEVKTETSQLNGGLSSLDESLRKNIVRTQYLSIIVTIAYAMILSLISYYSSETRTSSGVSSYNLIDVLCYVVVLWFYGANKFNTNNKEKNSLTALGIFFLLFSALLEFNSIFNLAKMVRPNFGLVNVIIDFVFFLIFVVLGTYTYVLACQTDVNSCLFAACVKLSVNSFSAIFSCLSTLLYSSYPAIWYFDSITGILIGLCMLVYSSKILLDIYWFKKM